MNVDEERLSEALGAYGRLIRRAIRRSCPRSVHLDVDEIEQQVRVRLWNALRGERNIGSLASYLYRVAANATIDAVRSAKSRGEEGLDAVEAAAPALVAPENESPEVLAAAAEIRLKVGEAMASLDPTRRRAVGLHLRGFTTQEIGELLGWSEPKARNLAYRGLADLRQALQERGIERGDET